MKSYSCFEGEASGEAWAPGAEAEAVEALALSTAAAASAALSAATSASRRRSWASGSIFSGHLKPWTQTGECRDARRCVFFRFEAVSVRQRNAGAWD